MTLAAAALLMLAQGDEGLEARRDAWAKRLEALRGLRFVEPLRIREGTRVEYARYVLSGARRLYGSDLDAAGAGLKALGLIPRLLRLDIAITARAGFGVKCWVDGGELVLLDASAGDDWILNKMAVGLVEQHHAPAAEATFDGQMALASLRMGDAEVVKYLVVHGGTLPKGFAARLRDEARDWEVSGSKFASAVAPRVLVRSADFPWRRGGAFAAALHADGGFAALDRAWARPPVSTEQILHPEKYAAGEAPVRVGLPQTVDRLKAAGWTYRFRTVLGELGTALVLESHLPREDHEATAAGWGGDTVAVFEKDGGTPATAWATVWDTASDAEAFHRSAVALAERLASSDPPRVSRAERRGATVLLLLQAPPELFEALRAAAWADLGD